MYYLNKFKNYLKKIELIDELTKDLEKSKLLFGRILANQVKAYSNFKESEFGIFSQFGDDGLIQFLINNLQIEKKFFVEFGVEDYFESNTRFLMMNNNWSGFVMDGSEQNIKRLQNSRFYWKYELVAKNYFVTKENINKILAENCPKDVGLLHIDLDGNDYWIWKEIDLDVIKPVIVILEYNSVFGNERAITIPYQHDFNRTKAHHSNLYWGASLKALHNLSKEKGYCFVGCNRAGNNAYFVRRDKLNSKVKEITLEEGFVISKYRESRDVDGNKTFLSGHNRLDAIKDMYVFNTETLETEKIAL